MEKTKGNGFSYWLKNVFVPHYLKYTIVGVVIVGIVFLASYDWLMKKKPDFTLTVASIGILREEDMTELKALIEDEVGDANGDGEVLVNFEIYIPTISGLQDDSQLGDGATGTNVIGNGPEGDLEMGAQILRAFDTSFMAETGNILYLYDDQLINRYPPDYYEKLADFGIESENPVFYKVNDIPVFDRIFVVDTGYFLCLKGWSESKQNDKEFIENYNLAARVFERILNAE